MLTQAQHGRHGYGEAKAMPFATKPAIEPVEVPQLLEAATPCDRLLLRRATTVKQNDPTSFRSTYEALPDADLDALIEGLERIGDAYAAWLKRVTKPDLLNLLADFADMLQVSPPNAGGIDLYLAAMDTVPAALVPIARVKVAKTHRYARLPLPADFEKAIAGEMQWCTNSLAWVMHLRLDFERARTLRLSMRRMQP